MKLIFNKYVLKTFAFPGEMVLLPVFQVGSPVIRNPCYNLYVNMTGVYNSLG